MKLEYCLKRKTIKCNTLVQKICMFLQKETSCRKSSFALGPQGPERYIFGDHFYVKNTRKLRFHAFPLFHARKRDIIILPEVDWIHKILWALRQLWAPGGSDWFVKNSQSLVNSVHFR